MAKKKCPECPSVPKWMTTFADLNSLLLTFFVLLLAMATFDKVKIEGFMDSILQGGRGIFDTRENEEITRQHIVSRHASAEATQSQQQQQQIMQSMKSYVEAQNMQNMISVIKTDRGFSIRILDSVFFQLGRWELQPAALPILDRITAMASHSPFYISIEGHTDDRPEGQFAGSNWDLSTNRALSVLKYMQSAGMPPAKLSATGFGEYHPFLPNITDENRSQNRRVEINFISPEFYESNKSITDDNIE